MPASGSARRGRRRPRPHLFVYGTLMRGYSRHGLLAGRAALAGQGTVAGRLLDLGRYPGLVAGRDRVRGELYRIEDPEVLPAVDDEEGYNFVRGRTTVTLAGGRGRVVAWIYRYRGPRQRAAPIAGGDYRRAAPVRRRNQ